MSEFLKCVKGKVSAAAYMQLEKEYAEKLKAASGDQQLANANLVADFEQRVNSVNKARVVHAIKYTELTDRVQRRYDNMLGTWEGYSPAAKNTARFFGREPSVAAAWEETLQVADRVGQQETRGVISRLTDTFESLGLVSGEIPSSTMNKVVKAMVDGINTAKDPQVRKIAQEFIAAQEMTLKNYRGAGGVLGEVENYVPVQHTASKMSVAGKDAWKTDFNAMQDWANTIDFQTGQKGIAPERAEEIMEIMWRNIISDGGAKISDRIEAGLLPAGGRSKTDLFSRRMQSRLTRPKNGQAYTDYMNKYGPGDDGLFGMVTSNLQGISHDTGVMKVLGPMPDDMNTQFQAVVKANGGTAGHANTINGMYRALVGRWEGTSDAMIARVVAGGQNLLSSSLLGTAPIAALTDHIFRATARQMNGLLGGPKATAAYTKAVAGMKPHEMVRDIHMMEAMLHASVNRFDASGQLPLLGGTLRNLNRAKNLNHRASRLHGVTMGMGDMASLDFSHTLGKMIDDKVSFGKLDTDLRNTLDMFDVSDSDWQRLMANGTTEQGFIHASFLPEDMADIGTKIGAAELHQRGQYTNSPDLFNRSVSSGLHFGAKVRGGGTNLAASSVMQFKSFPMMVWRQHFVPAAIRMADGNITPMMTLAVAGTVMGSLIVQMKEALKGNPLYEWDDGKLYTKGIMQAGILSLFGDVMLKDREGYARSLLYELIGPVPSVTAETIEAGVGKVQGAFQEGETDLIDLPDIINGGKKFLPGGTMWYFRYAFERQFLDSLNTALDPEYYDTIERRQSRFMKERGAIEYDNSQWNP